jgi:hypothetical protein
VGRTLPYYKHTIPEWDEKQAGSSLEVPQGTITLGVTTDSRRRRKSFFARVLYRCSAELRRALLWQGKQANIIAG